MLRTTAFFLLVSLAVLPCAGMAQCIGDDNLVGPCYQPTSANLPVFPAMKMKAKFIPWQKCTVGKVSPATLALPKPIPAACGIYVMSGVDLRLAGSGMPLWDTTSTWLMFYVRTWMESDLTPPGTRYQVWRFLINADVRPSAQALATPPGPTRDHIIPSCIYNSSAGQPHHYWGYIDYAYDCLNNQWSVAFGVNHMCDTFTHNFFTKFPAGGHPDWSYTVVAPDTFTPDPALPGIQGQSVAEAFRVNRLGILPLCETEQDVVSGLILTGLRKCPCASVGKQFIEHKTRASTKCKSSAVSFPISFFWGNSVQMSVGHFNGPGYPGKGEELYFIVDPMTYFDGKFSPPLPSIELFYGVGTQGGFKAFLFKPGISSPRAFIDQGNVLVLPNLFGLSGMAGLYASTKLIYLNTF